VKAPALLAVGLSVRRGRDAYQAAFPRCHRLNADCDQSGSVDSDDINAFVALLSGGWAHERTRSTIQSRARKEAKEFSAQPQHRFLL
jgi:hypothetical protein